MIETRDLPTTAGRTTAVDRLTVTVHPGQDDAVTRSASSGTASGRAEPVRYTFSFHVHGAGRFLVLARDGGAEPDLVWKDTVLIPTGQTVDILLDVTNPGLWTAHCHIAEPMHSGMMFSSTVDRAATS
jgi:hypothetical protein